LLIADGVPDGQMGYSDIAAIARRLSPTPKEDCHELFRRMVFNVMIENTDDHEKNHAFLFHQGEWRLSPAYDLLPQLHGIGYQQLRLGKQGNEASIANALSECERFMLKRNQAEAIVEQIHAQVKNWREIFAAAGVPSMDIDVCEKYILGSGIYR
jgi:serine/threonine-protein kinase HipA